MKFRDILEEIQGEKEEAKETEKKQKVPNEKIYTHKDITEMSRHRSEEIASEHEFFWRRENMKLVRVENDRAFFRVEVNLNVVMIPLDRFGAGEEPARLRNISAGGVCIGTKYQCCMGDRFLLKVKLLPEQEEWKLFCQVLRIEEKGVAGFAYGCQFVELNPEEQERLMESVLELRRRMRG